MTAETEATGVVDHGLSRDGLVLTRRHWRGASPRAVVLLVHGIAEHSGRYEHVGRAFAERGLDVVAYDQRGHGQSGGRRMYVDRFTELVDDVTDQLAALRATALPVVLLGHSMGGLVALSQVLTRAEPRPDLLVLSAPALDAGPPAHLLRPVVRVAAPLVPKLRARSAIDVSTLATDPAVGERYLADPLVEKTATVNLAAELFAQMDWARAHLHRLDLPTLVVHGGDDRLVPTRSSEPLAALAGVTRHVEPGMRHELFNEPVWRDMVARIAGWIDAQLGH